jgi:hypothetical protein
MVSRQSETAIEDRYCKQNDKYYQASIEEGVFLYFCCPAEPQLRLNRPRMGLQGLQSSPGREDEAGNDIGS